MLGHDSVGLPFGVGGVDVIDAGCPPGRRAGLRLVVDHTVVPGRIGRVLVGRSSRLGHEVEGDPGVLPDDAGGVDDGSRLDGVLSAVDPGVARLVARGASRGGEDLDGPQVLLGDLLGSHGVSRARTWYTPLGR